MLQKWGLGGLADSDDTVAAAATSTIVASAAHKKVPPRFYFFNEKRHGVPYGKWWSGDFVIGKASCASSDVMGASIMVSRLCYIVRGPHVDWEVPRDSKVKWRM